MTRTCLKCNGLLHLNDKLGLMECIENNHIEPINLNIAQWWNQCPDCKQMGLNTADQQYELQVVDVKDIKGIPTRVPRVTEVGEKTFTLVFKKVENQKECTCKACGTSFLKKQGE